MPLSEKAAVRLLDAVAALVSIAHYVNGETFDTYSEKGMLQAAVERQLEIVGEALGVFRRLDPVTAASIGQLARAVQLRNFLAHEYGAVDDQIIWEVATVYCPVLQATLTRLLAGDRI